MTRLVLAAAMLIASCSPGDPTDGENRAAAGASKADAANAEYFVGKPFSSLVAERREFLLRNRAISRAALGMFSEADGIEIPAQMRKIGGRDILVFFTCKRDRCSTASNVILVDLKGNAMEVANISDGKYGVIVDGPPDLAQFARTHCKGTACDASDVE